MPNNYATRDMSDPNQMKKNKQSMADLKLRRLTELNNRLREDLERERIPVSQAAKRCVFIGSRIEILTVINISIAASSTILLPRVTSWSLPSGELSTRRTTHTHHRSEERRVGKECPV